jgi:NAD-dependent deacetylase
MIQELYRLASDFLESRGLFMVLTGAGISAESDIPTFRGPEGYWTIGSRNYHPQEMATHDMFSRYPDDVWAWYLYRMDVCRRAEPNSGHLALVELENLLEDRFLLITQNVDNLHLRAGNSLQRTYQIHGNIFFMRCAHECTRDLYPLPEKIEGKATGERLNDRDRALLKCPRCGSRTRPHVLWFDEIYDDTFYYFQRSLRAASQTDLLLVVGTSGATNLPNQVVRSVYEHGGRIVDINIEEDPFAKLARHSGGMFIQGASSHLLKLLAASFREASDRNRR